MKQTKLTFLVAVAIGAIICLSGCKPKQVTLSGQIFIVTQGADNIKLGDVVVCLIDRQQVTNFLQNRQIEMASEIQKAKQDNLEAHQSAIDLAKAEVKSAQETVKNEAELIPNAQDQLDKAKAAYDEFMAAQPLRTNAIYLKVKRDLNFRTQLVVSQRQSIQELETELTKARNPAPAVWVEDYNGQFGRSGHWAGGGVSQVTIQADTLYLANAERDLEKTGAQIDADNQALRKMEQDVADVQGSKLQIAQSFLSAAQARLTQAQSRLFTAQINLETVTRRPVPEPNPITAENYFRGFPPVVLQKAISDPDGKFSIVYRQSKAVIIFAAAQRKVMDKTENYYWLVDAPNNVETAQLILSNNNLADVDPDNHLSVKFSGL